MIEPEIRNDHVARAMADPPWASCWSISSSDTARMRTLPRFFLQF